MYRGLLEFLHTTTTPRTLVEAAILNADLFFSFVIFEVKAIATLEGTRSDPAMACFFLAAIPLRKADFSREGRYSLVNGSNYASAKVK